ncbi:MAG TPA: ABC transporter permease [Vicinamibacterales bacterium]|nr:ABC transporter permease [Vicinamibacterales bacterium]
MKGVRRLWLAWIWCCAWLVPRWRRATWRAQWRADLWYYDRWLESESVGRLRAAAALILRAGGALPHAVILQFLEWSPVMLSHDVSFGARMLARRPAFTFVAVLMLGIGIGANATIFNWLQHVVLQPLPAVDVSRLVALHGTTATRDDLSFSFPNFVDLRASKPAGLEDLIAFRAVAMNLRGDGEPRRVWGELVTPNFFDVLRVEPALGRRFVEADHTAEVVVLSHGAWQRHFGGDPSIVGRLITLNARPFTVIGVTPEGFRGSVLGLSLDVFVPVGMQRAFMSDDRLGERGTSFLQVYGRLQPGASLQQAQAALDVAAARLAAAHPAQNEGRGIAAEPLWKAGAAGMMLPIMAILMAVVGVVLLIACANLAGLLLARAAGRQREVAIRLAVGASRARLVRQFLVESSMLAVLGGGAGVLLSAWAAGLLRLLLPPTPLPIAFESAVSPLVVLYATGVTFAAALAFGFLPALRASAPDPVVALKDVTSAAGGVRGRSRLRGALVVTQVALSLVLLVCAALFVRGLLRAQTMDTGFALREGVLASIDLLPNGYDPGRGAIFHQRLLERVAGVPAVVSATLASNMPLDFGGGSDTSVAIEGYVPAPGEDVQVYYNRVGDRYFETMGIDILAGRALDERDDAGRPLAVVVNETMARRYWANQDPVGRRIDFGSGPAVVVGVARDGKYRQLTEAPRNYMYVSLAQVFRHDALLIVRTSGDPAAVVPSLHAAVRELDPDLPLFDVRTIAEHLELSVFLPRIAGSILAIFGLLAVTLAVVGLYGLVALVAAQRTREIGIRMALGATRGDVLRLVLRQGMILTGIGLVTGFGLAVAAAQGIRSQLVGVGPTDAISFAGPAVLLAVVALVACALPARAATTLDPVTALRQE